MKSNYLPVGSKLAGHYEIVKLLGEDEFEILYVVKDLHLGEELFVLKELFLPSYASRNDDNSLTIMAKSKQIFEQTKQDIIAEIELLKTSQEQQSPRVYGYFEENNTLYTIMEFVNNSDISSYLEVNTQNEMEEEIVVVERAEEEIILPAIENSTVEEEKPKSTLFLKILIICVLIFLGLAFYGYQILQEEQQRIKEKSERNSVTVIKGTVIPHPPLESREEKQNEEKKEPLKEASVQEKNNSSDGAEYIELQDEDELESTVLAGVPKEEIYQTENDLEEIVANEEEANIFDEEDTFEEGTFEEDGFDVIETPRTNTERTNSLLGRRIN